MFDLKKKVIKMISVQFIVTKKKRGLASSGQVEETGRYIQDLIQNKEWHISWNVEVGLGTLERRQRLLVVVNIGKPKTGKKRSYFHPTLELKLYLKTSKSLLFLSLFCFQRIHQTLIPYKNQSVLLFISIVFKRSIFSFSFFFVFINKI